MPFLSGWPPNASDLRRAGKYMILMSDANVLLDNTIGIISLRTNYPSMYTISYEINKWLDIAQSDDQREYWQIPWALSQQHANRAINEATGLLSYYQVETRAHCAIKLWVNRLRWLIYSFTSMPPGWPCKMNDPNWPEAHYKKYDKETMSMPDII